ncbi:putative UPF0481 protein At3g02645 [Juglans microcarpa x Juglans regia]|uniref:putative UPF0481 protein At3g02645 n=1 Tax=Juglans microcarpa x Juglans regia TaxID=2249226 RepID=UPI001B7DDEEC|nr:putative UPF0481 protein At3g02645 [Juglans microcarpa x Juglans regia]
MKLPKGSDGIHDQWVIQISRALEEEGLKEDDDHEDVPITTIFTVPTTLMSSKPETYTPQLVALGPYHHKRPQLLEMERCKLDSAKRMLKNFKQIKFHDLVSRIAERDCVIRACYHRRFLEFDQETLSWIFAIDSSFLLDCLQTYFSEAREVMEISSNMSNQNNCTRKKNAYRTHVLKDVIMMENQIPLFLLKEVHGFFEHEDQDAVLSSILLGVCKYLSPIKYINHQHFTEECFTRAHLLDLLYYMIVPKLTLVADFDQQEKMEDQDEEIGWFRKAMKSILIAVCFLLFAPLRILKRIFQSKVVKRLAASELSILSRISGRAKNSTVTNILSSAENVAEKLGGTSFNHISDESPSVDEIAIPSVTQLHKIGVKFRPVKGGLRTINFDKSSGTFYLPIIHLDDNSDVVLRNLVAYEACIAPEVMVFTRYTEFMNGIIDTEQDVRILREAGIILNRLKSDAEVATLWNGMTKSVRATKVPILDKPIEDANTYYSKSWKVRINMNMKNFILSSWPCLTFLTATILILLFIVETACNSSYDCSKLWAAL